MPDLIFMYGFPASGKTTYAKALADRTYNAVYLAADDIRKELYGSQDEFGTPDEIYRLLLARMIKHLKAGDTVIYDACNLYQSFRMDYLTPVAEAGLTNCRKILIRMNTTKETCIANHERRGRNFSLDNVMHYFQLEEYPNLSEGWDEIRDVPDHALETVRFYMAAPILENADNSQYKTLTELLRQQGHAVTSPLEHKFHDPAAEWSEYMVGAISQANMAIFLDDGRHRKETKTTFDTAIKYGLPLLTTGCAGSSLHIDGTGHIAFGNIWQLAGYDFLSIGKTNILTGQNTNDGRQTPVPEKRLYKTVSNYLSNELGLNRTVVEDILRKKIEDRNIDKLIQESVEAYFSTGHDACSRDHIKTMVETAIQRHIQDSVKRSGNAMLGALIQRQLDILFQNTKTIAVAKPDPTRPNRHVYPTAVLLEWDLISDIVMKWLTDILHGELESVSCTVTPGAKWQIDMTGLKTASPLLIQKLTDAVKPDSHESYFMSSACHGYSKEWTLPNRLIQTLLSDSAGYPVNEIVPCETGILCLPARI